MGEIKRDWDVLPDAEHQKAINEIITFFSEERSEKIGVVAAGQILDFFLRITTSAIYNKALDDVKSFLEKKLRDTLFDVDTFLRKQ